MNRSSRNGRIITFYSYKGGTGRSMALANLAWLIASEGKKVLVIDWDLEAPGLHRYFRPFLVDTELTATDGLLEYVERYANACIQPRETDEAPTHDWFLPYVDFSDYIVEIDYGFGGHGSIHLLPAGRQTDHYAVTVSSFNWQNFYDRLGGGGFIEAFREAARNDYDYVLVDSRTGVSDTAGICTVQMPDTLVVCFTYNNQSIKGSAAIARSALRHRHAMIEGSSLASSQAHASRNAPALGDTPPPLRIFPVPMRVDGSESDRLALRQSFARDTFRDLVSQLPPESRNQYWAEVEVPHVSFYSYEEVLSPFKDFAKDPRSMLAAFIRIAGYVTNGDIGRYPPDISVEDRVRILATYATNASLGGGTTSDAESAVSPIPNVPATESEAERLARAAETLVAGLGAAELESCRRVLCRVVRIATIEEGGGVIPIRVELSEFAEDDLPVIRRLAKGGILEISVDRGHRQERASLPNDRIPGAWLRLSDWLNADRDFLLWRQQLRVYLTGWTRGGASADADSALLSGPALNDALYWSERRTNDLNETERKFIHVSLNRATTPVSHLHAKAARSRAVLPWATVGGLLVVLVTSATAYFSTGRSSGPASAAAPSLASVDIEAASDSAAEAKLSAIKAQQSAVIAQQAASDAAQPVESVQSSSTPESDKLRTAQYLAPKMRLDIFWCDSPRSGKTAQDQANMLSRDIMKELRFEKVQVKKITADINKRPGYDARGLQVRPDTKSPEEQIVAQALIATDGARSVADTIGGRWTEHGSTQESKGYLSVFICPIY